MKDYTFKDAIATGAKLALMLYAARIVMHGCIATGECCKALGEGIALGIKKASQTSDAAV